MKIMFGDIYSGRRVLLTGHNGFKGSWLSFWLKRMEAQVCGIALPPNTEPNHYSLLKPAVRSVEEDIRNRNVLDTVFQAFRPEIVFHLAAQPLVRKSYENPLETFETNVMGTVNVLESCRKTPSVRAVVVISSDKCYENREQMEGYTEKDPLGGFDPYSASKGCTELVAASYRNSFLNNAGILLATARAGNVIGGGDWAEDRLVPDAIRSAAEGEEMCLRNPASIRPWQHVLEPLSGYLLLGQKLFEGDRSCAEAWNFGPDKDSFITTERAVELLGKGWNAISCTHTPEQNAPRETRILLLDCEKAKSRLAWEPVWNAETAFRRTAAWYREYYTAYNLLTQKDLDDYILDAGKKGLLWTN